MQNTFNTSIFSDSLFPSCSAETHGNPFSISHFSLGTLDGGTFFFPKAKCSNEKDLWGLESIQKSNFIAIHTAYCHSDSMSTLLTALVCIGLWPSTINKPQKDCNSSSTDMRHWTEIILSMKNPKQTNNKTTKQNNNKTKPKPTKPNKKTNPEILWHSKDNIWASMKYFVWCRQFEKYFCTPIKILLGYWIQFWVPQC